MRVRYPPKLQARFFEKSGAEISKKHVKSKIDQLQWKAVPRVFDVKLISNVNSVDGR